MTQIERTPSGSTAEIREEAPTSTNAQYCLARYYAELQTRFEAGFDPGDPHAPTPDELLPPSGAFLVLHLDGRPVGCGGLKRLDVKRAYIKRMWISPETRGLGLGKRILQALEERARALGYEAVCLETNRSLGEAQQLYLRSGYREVSAFNDEPYAHHWFEKRLSP